MIKLDFNNLDPVTENAIDGTFMVGGQRIGARTAASILAYFQDRGDALLTVDGDHWLSLRGSVRGIAAAMARKDVVGTAHALVDLNTTLLPHIGVRILINDDLTGMPVRESASRAARAAADTVERFPTETANAGCEPATLRQAGTNAEAQYVAREGFQRLERVIGANELPNLTLVRDQVKNVITALGPKAETHPQIADSMSAALLYNKRNAEQAAQHRVTNDAWREETRKKLAAEVSSAAREVGRQEALAQIKDRLSTAIPTEKK